MGPQDHEGKSISEVNPRIESHGYNNSIYKKITYSYHLHARRWVHGAMSALNFLTVYLKKSPWELVIKIKNIFCIREYQLLSRGAMQRVFYVVFVAKTIL